jgi:hypothetical protein
MEHLLAPMRRESASRAPFAMESARSSGSLGGFARTASPNSIEADVRSNSLTSGIEVTFLEVEEIFV